MLLTVIALLMTTSIYLLLYQFKFIRVDLDKAHLPTHTFKDSLDIELSGKNHFLPLTNRFKDLEQRLPATGNLKRKLIRAGSPMGILEFLSFKILSLISVPWLGSFLLGSFFPRKDIFLLVSLAVGYFLPEIWLNKQVKRRQHEIRKDLPNIIDLLNLCVSAGLDFMLAVNRVVKDLRPCELTGELAEVYRETQIGKSRKEALKNFAWRIDMPEVYSFVRTLVQADRMGTPMAEALKLQSDEIRVRRFQRGEAMALKAPIKLLLPLFVFILPVVLVLVAGPIFLEFNKAKITF